VRLARQLSEDLPLLVWPTALNVADPAAVEQLITEVTAARVAQHRVPTSVPSLGRPTASMVASCVLCVCQACYVCKLKT
jgi:hypothetical protein